MSLFESLGEKVERFKQEAEAARDDATEGDSAADRDTGPEYRCLECDAEFRDERETCPNCGAEAVVFDGE